MPQLSAFSPIRWPVLRCLYRVGLFCALTACCVPVATAEVLLPSPDQSAPLIVQADSASQWTAGVYQVRHLHGQVIIQQGTTKVQASQAVVWLETSDSFDVPTKAIVYLEGTKTQPVLVEAQQKPNNPQAEVQVLARQQAPNWFGRFYTVGGVEWRMPPPIESRGPEPAIAQRGFAKLSDKASPAQQAAQQATKVSTKIDPAVKPAQFAAPPIGQPLLAPPPATTVPNPNGVRAIGIFSRNGVGSQAESIVLPSGERVGVLSGGYNIVIEGIATSGVPTAFGPVDSLDIETDRAVVWSGGNDILIGGQSQQSNDTPLEVYLEGNIVFRQGDRTIYADRMYYDVRRRTGVVLNGELLTPVPTLEGYDYRGKVRLKADVIRQLDEARFVANNALLTTSRLEVPSSSIRSETIAFEDVREPIIDPFTGQQAVDPTTGIPRFDHKRLARSRNNTVNVAGIPVFYWPTIATNLEKPTYYIDDFQIRNDSIFGTQVLVDLDIYQLLGIEGRDGTDWSLNLDYLSERGFGYGTTYEYDVDSFAGINGPALGRADLWAINDGGVDNLGFGRRTIVPEKEFRGRAFWNHRQKVTDGFLAGWTAQAEVGWISDRTFLEQYYEREWDENKDQSTGGRLKRIYENQSFSIEANARLNDFFTQTEWLPRIDHYILGQELLGDSLTWFAHSQAGYANHKVASTPSNPELQNQFSLFPWEANVQGERFVTRQEIDLPLDFAPFKVVPYALGEFAHWGADINGDEVQRAYMQGGVRASIPFWAVNPNVRDPLFNLNGLAHKVVFDAELSYADANENVDRLVLYDELEDDSLEDIRRRFFFPNFATDVGAFYNLGPPPTIGQRFDPRFYAIRSGIQGSVSSPTTELVEDLTALRMGMRHRLQTKRGVPGQERIVDWLTFDANATWFPNENRDNLGNEFGLIDYDLVWNLGDRFAIVSDGYADLFGEGLRTVSGGFRINRPSRGNVYVGYRTIRGPFSADVITATANYRLSPKWIAGASTVLDFSEAGNIGQSLLLSRIGESLIATMSVNVDESKDNVGVSFFVEPRFLPRTGLSRRTGIDIPPPSYQYLE